MVGSSLRRDRAFITMKPPRPSGMTAASAPPATMRSASPLRMTRHASPMEWFPVAQAVEMLRLGREARKAVSIILAVYESARRGGTPFTPA